VIFIRRFFAFFVSMRHFYKLFDFSLVCILSFLVLNQLSIGSVPGYTDTEIRKGALPHEDQNE